MMRPIQNLKFDQRFREGVGKPFTSRINVFAKIRMMDETFAADFQFDSQFAEVRLHDVRICMHEGIETENEID